MFCFISFLLPKNSVSRTYSFVFLGCLLVTGCIDITHQSTSLPHVHGSSGVVTWSKHGSSQPGIDQASVFHVGTAFVLWSDLPNGGGGDVSTNMHGITCSGRLRGHEGMAIDYKYVSEDGAQGTANVDGRTYDLTKGNLFLVATEGKMFRIKQLVRDLTGIPFTPPGLQDWAMRDDEIKQFFVDLQRSVGDPTANGR